MLNNLVTTKELLSNAKRAVVAFNVNNMELIQGIMQGAVEMNCDVILQASTGARKYAGGTYIKKLVEAASEDIKAKGSKIRIALHLDHGATFEDCKAAIDDGFTSVMIDGSHYPFEENVELTKRVVEYAHSRGVSVEGELGVLAGIEDDVSSEVSHYTDPMEAKEFVRLTGVDSLAISIGTSHGAFKYAPGSVPNLAFDVLKKIHEAIPNTPLVLHGASSVIQEDVAIINAHGGAIKDAQGVSEEVLAKSIPLGVKKINVDSDLRLAFTSALRKYFHDNPSHFDPRQYLAPARNHVAELVKLKLRAFSV